MKYLKSYEIRQMWLDFWKSKGHEVFPSASLIPVNDPTLLWINAGVAPLKKFFDGREVPTNRRICNAQKAIRTNDIDNVGRTARHHTFFEMLGNFSIGDYFRKEALTWAFEILTSEKWFGFDINKLYFTIYPDDKESYELWTKLGVDPTHIIPLKDNFWEIGEGPCGPDSEIFYDRGEKYDPQGLGIKLLKEDIENDRYIEIWNIVFSQFNSDPKLKREEYKELPSKNIDTGMGLERMACIIQGAETNYETDLFMPLINKLEEMTNVKYEGQMAFKVIADHIRSVTFAISDGANLSNEGRGYVLRRILRRACRYGKILGMHKPFMYNLVDIVCDIMKPYYPYLENQKEMVKKIIKTEEEKFLQTLETGEKKLNDYLNSNNVVSKEFAFLLYDTFGFPIELTQEVASEKNATVDLEGFKDLLAKQKASSKGARVNQESMNLQNEDMLNFKKESLFVGYDALSCDSHIIGVFKDGKSVQKASGVLTLVFDKTCFYATSGGQIGDQGKVIYDNKEFAVLDSFNMPNTQHAVKIDTKDYVIDINKQDKVTLKVDEKIRLLTSCNHSGTHLLNESLRKVLGSHVKQQGSSVNSESLRFDFNNFSLPTDKELLEVEDLVNKEIVKASDVSIVTLPLEEAKKLGVQAVFGEKYGKEVRVVTIGFSKELCGGTHVKNTKDIQKLAILSVESKGSGIFRVECVTGSEASISEKIEQYVQEIKKEINELRNKANNIIVEANNQGIKLNAPVVKETINKASYQTIIDYRNELASLKEVVKDLDKDFTKQKREKNTLNPDDYLPYTIKISGNNILIFKVNDADANTVKDLVDKLSDKLEDSFVLACNIASNKILFIAKSKIKELKAGEIVKTAAAVTKGGGGGRDDFAQAGGKDLEKVDEALSTVKEFIEGKL